MGSKGGSVRAVDDGEFWALIDVMGGVADGPSVARLTAALGDQGHAEEFQQRVDAAVRELGPERFAGMTVDGLPLVGEVLESFLLAVVAAGRDVHAAVRASPASAAGREWDLGQADLLGLIHEENDAPGWCRPRVAIGTARAIPYADAVYEIAFAMGGRADWRDWWAAADREFLDLRLEQDDADTGRVSRGRKVVRAVYQLPMRRPSSRGRGVSAGVAAEDMARIMAEVAGKLELPAPPAVPVPARLSELRERRAGR